MAGSNITIVFTGIDNVSNTIKNIGNSMKQLDNVGKSASNAKKQVDTVGNSNFGDKITKQSSTASNGLNSLKNVAKTVGSAMVSMFAFNAILDFGKGVGEATSSMLNLETMLAKWGASADQTKNIMSNLTTTSSKYGIAMEDITSQFSMLKSLMPELNFDQLTKFTDITGRFKIAMKGVGEDSSQFRRTFDNLIDSIGKGDSTLLKQTSLWSKFDATTKKALEEAFNTHNAEAAFAVLDEWSKKNADIEAMLQTNPWMAWESLVTTATNSVAKAFKDLAPALTPLIEGLKGLLSSDLFGKGIIIIGGFAAAMGAAWVAIQVWNGFKTVVSTIKSGGEALLKIFQTISGSIEKLPKMGGKGSELDTVTKETEDIAKKVDKLNNIKINVKSGISNVLRGAAIALVAIGAALVLLLAALAAIAVFGVAYKAVRHQVDDAIRGIMALTPGLITLTVVAGALALIGLATGGPSGIGLAVAASLIGSGLVVALIAIGAALVLLVAAAYGLAGFGSAIKPIIPQIEQASEGLELLTTALKRMLTSLGLISLVNYSTIFVGFSTFAKGFWDTASQLVTGKSLLENALDNIANTIKTIKSWVDKNSSIFNDNTASKLNNLSESLKPLKSALDALKTSIGDLKSTLQTYKDLKWEQFWQGMTVGSAIAGVMDLLDEVSTTISSRTIDSTVSTKLSKLNDALNPLTNILGSLKNTISSLKSVIDGYGELTTGGGGSGWDAVKNPGKGEADIPSIIGGVMTLLDSIATTLASHSLEKINGAKTQLEALNTALGPITSALSAVKTGISSILDTVTTYKELKDKQDKLGMPISEAINKSFLNVSDVATAVKTWWDLHSADVLAVGPILTQLQAPVGQIAPILSAVRDAINNIITTVQTYGELSKAQDKLGMPVSEAIDKSFLNVSDVATAVKTWWDLHSADVLAAGSILTQLLPIVTSMASNLSQLRSAIDSLVGIVSGMTYLAGKDIKTTIKDALTKVQEASDQLKDHGLTDPGTGAETAVGKIRDRLKAFQTAIDDLPTIDYSSIQGKIDDVKEAKKKLGELSTALSEYATKNASLPVGQRGPSFNFRDSTFGPFKLLTSNYIDNTIRTDHYLHFDDLTINGDNMSLADIVKQNTTINNDGISKQWFESREFKQILQKALRN